MATYRTTSLPGEPEGDRRRLLGANSLGQSAFLTRACLPHERTRQVLETFAALPPSHPQLARLVEIGEDLEAVWVVETAVPCLSLQVVAARSVSEGLRMAPELAAWVAMRLCQICQAMPTPHLRLTPRNCFLQPDGEPYVLGAGWARLLPADADDAPFLPGFEDARADAYAAAEIARQLAGGASAWDRFPPPVRAALERAGAGPRRSWMLHPAELAQELLHALGPDVSARQLTSFLQSVPLPRVPSLGPQSATVSLRPLALAEPRYDEPAQTSGPAMSIDGTIEGEHVRPTRDAPGLRRTRSETPSLPRQQEAELELDPQALAHAMAPPPDTSVVAQARAEQAQRRSGVARKVAVVLAVLVAFAAVAGAGLWWMYSHQRGFTFLKGQLSSGGPGLLRITSRPEGAQVRIGAEVVGQTPFVGDTDYADGEFTVFLEKDGFEPAVLKVDSRESKKFDVRLVPKSKK